MEHLQLDLEVLTPAFTSGADQGKAELPPATMRGMLRWWWRALNCSVGLETLKVNEGRIFGSAEMKMKSPLRIRVSALELPEGTRLEAPQINGEVLRYLGFGLWNSNPKRQAVPPGSCFSLGLDWSPGVFDEPVVTELIEAACAWVTLGGVGSRSRRGWGSLALRNISGSAGGFSEKRLSQLWSSSRSQWLTQGKSLDEVSPWPDLASRQVHLGPRNDSAKKALELIGDFYRAKKRAKAIPPWVGGEIVGKWSRTSYSRRASSILLTVVKDGDGFRGVISLLPCLKDKEGSGGEEMLQFAEEFARWRIP